MNWSQIEPILKDVLDMPAGEREAYLDSRIDADENVREEVRSLAAAYDSAPGFLEDPAAEFVSPAMDVDEADPVIVAGRSLGPYVVEEQIGRGGMGVVYRATRHDVGKTVALKLIRTELFGDDDVKRFMREQRMLARLEHPNIAQLVDAGVTERGSPWFAMQLVEGVPIIQYVRDRKMSIRRRLELFTVVCQAVRHAHRHLVIHRDIKPGNILVTDDGRVKLLDFGIAKLLDEDPDLDAVVTRTDARRLTLDYASPEQVAGGAITTASDIYSLGILLYELLTGTRPYETAGAAHTEVVRRICEVMPPAPSSRTGRDGGSSIDKDLDRVVLMALKKEPDRRYPSVDALLADIDRYLSGLPVSATPDRMAYRVRKFVTRHRVAVASVSAAVLVLVVIVAMFTSRLADERDYALGEAEKSREVTQFLVSMFEETDPYQSAGDTITAHDLIDRGAERLDRFDRYPGVKAALLDVIGTVNRNLARFDKADASLQEALEIQKNLGSPAGLVRAHMSYAAFLHLKAESGLADSLYQLASDLDDDEEVLSRIERAELMSRRGKVKWSLGDYDEAGRLYARSLDVMRVEAEPDDDRLAALLQNAAVLQRWLGNSDSAMTLLAEAEGIYEANGSMLDLAEAKQSRIALLSQDARYDEALQVVDELYDEASRILGPDHPLVATAVWSRALTLKTAGRLDESGEGFRQAIEMRRRIYGPTHSSVGRALLDLGETEITQGKLDSAEVHLLQSLEIAKAYGEVHHRIGEVYGRLGLLKRLQGRPGESADFHRKALAVRTELFPYDSPWVTIDLYNIALMDHESGRLETAEVAFRDVVHRDSVRFGGRHIEVGVDLTKLGVVLSDRNKLDDAKVTLERSRSILSDTLQSDHWRLADTFLGLADVNLKRGDFDEALSQLQQAIRIRTANFEEDDPRIWEAANALGVALALKGEIEEGEMMAIDHYGLIEERFGAAHWNTRKAGSRVRLMYERLGTPEGGRKFASLTDL